MNITTAHFHIYQSAPPAFSTDTMAAMDRAMQDIDRGETPATPSAATDTPPVQPGEYWPSQGGHYVCTLPAMPGLPTRHLIVGAAENGKVEWGPRDNEAQSAKSQIDGRANTAALLAAGDHPAAQWASKFTADGHNDFHLPSRFELFMCWLCTPQLFSKDGWYWSSSQASRYYAWCQDFEYGGSNSHAKDNELRARPVRWIQL
ncbi:DUF1566 domain-containing protein [Comamonas odontotermitis]|uniref:DUF1566 domain-containing protein n=1 Tax=Comamonas odontotermitis TaxID=379895 RepID=UPI0036709DA8